MGPYVCPMCCVHKVALKSNLRLLPASLVALGILMSAGDVCAQEGGGSATSLQVQAQIRAAIHEEYDRVVFDWPVAVSYHFLQNGPQVTLRFPQRVAADLSLIAKRHLTKVLHAEQMISEGQSTITLILKPETVARHVQQGKLLILDFYAGHPPILANTAPTSSLPQAVLISGEMAASSAASEPPSFPAPLPESKETRADTQPLLAMQPALEQTASPQAPDLSAMGDDALALLTIDPGIVTGAAIYRRADYVYIVFSKKITAPISSMLRETPRVTVESLSSANGSVYRFYMPQDLNLRCTRDDNRWTILVSKKVPSAPISLTITPQPDYALGPRVMIPVSKSEEPVRFTDPELRDDLVIVPVVTPGQAVRQAYQYADFRFVPSEQGVVVRPLVDAVDVKRQSLGIEITREKGLRLSPSKDTGMESDARANVPMKDQLFDLNGWYGPSRKSYTDMRQHWQQTLAEVPINERDRVRLNMARFYFARNHAHEALGLINFLAQQVPDLLHRSEFLALRGAVRVLIHDASAIEDLNSPDIINYPEMKLWRAVAKTRLMEWKEADELFESADSVLEKYPEPFFTKFSIAAVEAAIASKNKSYATKVLDRLVTRYPEIDVTSGPVNYLRGVLMSLTDHLERAEQYWDKAAHGKDQLYKVRSKLSLTDYQVISGKITPLEAATKLEHLRYAWRGDDLELDILRRIGKFYIEGGKMEEGLSTLRQAMSLLPDNDAAKQLHMEMAFAFRDVFLGDKHKDLSPLDALSLYERFYDLAPPGAEGDAIIRSLAQRMVSLDLLDRAAALLADQAVHRLSGPIKTRIGTQAAGIYLLDRKAQASIDILKNTDDKDIPDDLMIERALLKAKALASLERNDEAKAILKNVNSEYATRLLVDMAWRAHDWADAANLLDNLIGPAPKDGLKIETAQLVISRAIALALINDKAGLDSMRTNFSALMKDMPQEELFKVLCEPESGLPRDPAAIKSLTADVELFQPYLENYRNLN